MMSIKRKKATAAKSAKKYLSLKALSYSCGIPYDRLRHALKKYDKQTVLTLNEAVRLALALRLSPTDANDLLARCGYCLDYDVTRDFAVYKEAIENAQTKPAYEVSEILEKVRNTRAPVGSLACYLENYESLALD